LARDLDPAYPESVIPGLLTIKRPVCVSSGKPRRKCHCRARAGHTDNVAKLEHWLCECRCHLRKDRPKPVIINYEVPE